MHVVRARPPLPSPTTLAVVPALPRTVRRLLAAGCLLVLVATTGCTRSTVVEGDAFTLLRQEEEVDFGPSAPIEGTLEVAEGGCLAVRTDGGQFLLVFTAGTSTTDDGVEVDGLGEIPLGGSFRASGGYEPQPLSENSGLPRVPAECSAEQPMVAILTTIDSVG